MSLNTVIAFALLLKKITRKGSMGKKNFTQRMRRNTTTAATASAASTSKKKAPSISSSSSSDFEEEEQYHSHQDFHTVNHNNKNSSLIVTPPSIKSLRHSQIKVFSSSDIVIVSTDDLQTDQKLTSSLSLILPPPPPPQQHQQQQIVVRDFAYPPDSPLHFGRNALTALDNQSAVSLSSPDFNGRDARALFDFTPETEYEIVLKAGQTIWVQYRQCPGWLIADVQDETGLIPESYVEFI